jgi:hypothetical protein
MIGGNESINNVLNKRELNSTIQGFINEARHEFCKYIKKFFFFFLENF